MGGVWGERAPDRIGVLIRRDTRELALLLYRVRTQREAGKRVLTRTLPQRHPPQPSRLQSWEG